MTAEERAAILQALNSPAVSEPTRRVLLQRLDQRFERQFFDADTFDRLRALARVLVPHDPAELDLTGTVDHRLAGQNNDGWRYDDTPPDGEAYRALLHALPEHFGTLDAGAQELAVREIQAAHRHTFEDLLAELTEAFMAHPLTQYRFGYAGFMDVPNWPRVGPNELEARERTYGEQYGEQTHDER